ncbi:MAG: hypothetical protein V3S46_04365 [Nitrospinota bacterium]
MAEKDRLSMLTWLIDRYDVLRVAISRRAAIVLSADAILVTATVFLFGKFLGGYSDAPETTGTGEKYMIALIIIFAVTAIGLLSLSIISATYSIVNVWIKSHELTGEDTPRIYFLHARDTYEDLKDFTSFRKKLADTTDDDMLKYAEAELWRVTVATYYRHADLRRAIQFLYYAIFPFFMTLLIYSIIVAISFFGHAG